MKEIISDFENDDQSELTALRTIILFGRNVSTYKFALCSALMQEKVTNQIRYSDIRDNFLKGLIKHFNSNSSQYQAGKNQLTDAFTKYNNDRNWSDLIKIAEKNIYNNVFEAFHNVGGSSIEKKHLLFENDKKSKRIILTDNLNKILENNELSTQIATENESRWKIVEEAWKNKLSPNNLVYNSEDENFYSVTQNERTNLRKAVDVLSPYQHGKCFYCNRKLDSNVNKQADNFPDVDHFIPHVYLKSNTNINPDGVWNLVIACKKCNRGQGGKFESPPSKDYQTKLITRNVLYTQEHRHSLKNSIKYSLNAETPDDVEKKMKVIFNNFHTIEGWKPLIIYPNESI